METHPITKAVEIVGLHLLAKELGLTYQAILKWQAKSRMPRTEWTGETKYSEIIEKLTKGEVTKRALLSTFASRDVQPSSPPALITAENH
jgi:hypothetical protein